MLVRTWLISLKTFIQSLHFLHPMIFVSSIHSKRTLPFYFYNPNRLNGFIQKFYVVLHLLFSYFSLNYGGILSWLTVASGRFFKTVFTTEHIAQMKSLLAVLSLHNVCYVCLQTWRKQKKTTLIAAFLANATSLFVHAPLKGGCIILRCSLRCFDTVFRRPCLDFSSS